MTEGELSSAIVERLQLKESVGKVIWHSLDENGNIGEYDMKFGDTIVQRILPEDVKSTEEKLHEHTMQRRDD